MLVVFIAYSNSLHGPFIFDDLTSILGNPTIRHLSQIRTVLAPPNAGETVDGRPLLNLSLALNWALGGINVSGYHVTNLAIHVLASLTLFGIVRRTLMLPSMRRRFVDSADLFAAAVAGIWALHPLQTESVTYIVQRAESLAGLLYLFTLYGFIRGVRSQHTLLWFSASLISCALGMGVKEIMVSAPLIVMLYDRAFTAQSFSRALTRRWIYYAALATTWMPLAYLVVGAGSRGGTALSGNISSMDYLRTQCFAIAHYLRLSLWPSPLVLDYGSPVIRSFEDVLPQTILIGSLCLATLLALWSAPKLGFLGACFFATIAPTSSVIPVLTQTIAEHRMYLPLAAIVVSAALVIQRISEMIESETMATAIATAAIALVAVLTAGTYQRNAAYSSELSIWQDTVMKNPENSRAQMGVGLALMNLGSPLKAMPYFERAAEIDPTNPRAFNNRALAHYRLGEFRAAIDDDTTALRLEPQNPRAYNNRGTAYYALGENTLAIEDYSASLRLRPKDGGTYVNRAMAYLALKDYARAQDDVIEAEKLGIIPAPQLLRALSAASKP